MMTMRSELDDILARERNNLTELREISIQMNDDALTDGLLDVIAHTYQKSIVAHVKCIVDAIPDDSKEDWNDVQKMAERFQWHSNTYLLEKLNEVEIIRDKNLGFNDMNDIKHRGLFVGVYSILTIANHEKTWCNKTLDVANEVLDILNNFNDETKDGAKQ